MRKDRNLISLLLIIAIVLFLFAGCSNIKNKIGGNGGNGSNNGGSHTTTIEGTWRIMKLRILCC